MSNLHKLTGILLFAVLLLATGCPRTPRADSFDSIKASLQDNYKSIRAEYQKNKSQEFSGEAEFLEEEGLWVKRKLTSISENYLIDVQKTNKIDVPYIAYIEFLYYYDYGEWQDDKQATAGQPDEERKESERCYFTYVEGKWEVSESRILSTMKKDAKGKWEDIPTRASAPEDELPPAEKVPEGSGAAPGTSELPVNDAVPPPGTSEAPAKDADAPPGTSKAPETKPGKK